MLLSVMSLKRKQRDTGHAKEHGEFLAGWLNRFEGKSLENAENSLLESPGVRPNPKGFVKGFAERTRRDTETFLHRLVVLYVEAERDLENFDGGASLAQPEWWNAFLGVVRGSHPFGMRAVRAGELRLRSLDWSLRFDAVFRPLPDGRMNFELVAENDSSQVLLALAALINSGDAIRIRRCRGCEKFFFAWPRTDRQECSPRCKTAYWQKTPAGRERKAAYMRELRAKRKKLWEAKQKGRKRRRGRNVHVDLKKGE